MKEKLICKHCKVEGTIFHLSGEYNVGHLCKVTGRWTMRRLPGIDFLKAWKEVYGLE